jgi:mono/diheme cytochrome c family protein
MLKSTLLLFVGAFIFVAPLANAGRAPKQAAAPDAAAAPQAAAPAAAPAAATKNPVKPTAESQAKAKQLYSFDCSMCHNDNGNGKSDLASSMGLSMPDLTDPKTLESKSDGDLFTLFRTGKDKMPGEDPARAKDNEIWNLVLYVRGLSKTQSAAVTAK